jgi:hypothetical protein
VRPEGLQRARPKPPSKRLGNLNGVEDTLRLRYHLLSPMGGWGAQREALIEVWGKVPPYRGRGRRPTKKQPQAGWQYLQMLKQREQGTGGRVRGVRVKTLYYGEDSEVRELLGESTSCVERAHLTPRGT